MVLSIPDQRNVYTLNKTGEEVKLNEPAAKIRCADSCQHLKLYSDPLRAYKREPLVTLGSQQKGLVSFSPSLAKNLHL